MLACILPGIFPVVASGALLAASGQGLQFASVVALTVSFGLGLSATIHFLNRLRLEDDPGEDSAHRGRAGDGARRAGADPDLDRARLRAGGDGAFRPAVAAPVRLAQRLRDDAALVADLLILRPTAMFLRRAANALAARRAGTGGAP